MYRKNGPATSKLAVSQHQSKLSERRMQTLELVSSHPDHTAGELSRAMLAIYNRILPVRTCVMTPTKRLSELERMGMVERLNPRKCSDSGYIAHVWRITPLGKQVIENGGKYDE